MKIYFAGSIRGGRDDAEMYMQLIEHIQTKAEVLTEHIGSPSLTSEGESQSHEEFIHNRDMEWLLSSDAIIAEVSTPSLGVGYEIGRALEHGKKVLCLYRSGSEKKLSAMVRGSKDLMVIDYESLEDATQAVDTFFSSFN